MEILDAERDEARWLGLWHGCGSEPFAHPRYGRLFAGPDDRAIALVVDQPTGTALVPLIVRTVCADRWDATSPYGYGGPFFSAGGDTAGVLDALSRWAVREGLCSIFLRLGLDVDPPARAEVAQVSQNVVVDLRRTPDDVWRQYAHKVRKNVKKALRAGCTVGRFELLDDVPGFADIYRATMLRRGAPAWYHFDAAFLTRLAEDLAGSCSAFAVRDGDGRMVSVEIVLESDRYLYSFLGGTLADAFPMSPNDLLKHEIVQYGQRTGRSGFVLGGGYQPDDGIFRYKRAFDPTGVRPFHVAKIIGDRQRYAELVAARSSDGASQPATGYFPAYRAP